MECIFLPELNENSSEIIVNKDESHHLMVLRLKDNEKISATNGCGLFFLGSVFQIKKGQYRFVVENVISKYGENRLNITLAIAVLENKERFEMQIEKAIEFGVNKIIPIYTEFSSKKKLNLDRLKTKVITATKQTKRSFLAEIVEPIKINGIMNQNFDKVFLADENGEKDFNINKKDSNILVLIGSEGGFSINEIKLISNLSNVQKVNLGNRRLRAETATFAILSNINLKLQNIS